MSTLGVNVWLTCIRFDGNGARNAAAPPEHICLQTGHYVLHLEDEPDYRCSRDLLASENWAAEFVGRGREESAGNCV
jgi:hypothetical protein